MLSLQTNHGKHHRGSSLQAPPNRCALAHPQPANLAKVMCRYMMVFVSNELILMSGYICPQQLEALTKNMNDLGAIVNKVNAKLNHMKSVNDDVKDVRGRVQNIREQTDQIKARIRGVTDNVNKLSRELERSKKNIKKLNTKVGGLHQQLTHSEGEAWAYCQHKDARFSSIAGKLDALMDHYGVCQGPRYVCKWYWIR